MSQFKIQWNEVALRCSRRTLTLITDIRRTFVLELLHCHIPREAATSVASQTSPGVADVSRHSIIRHCHFLVDATRMSTTPPDASDAQSGSSTPTETTSPEPTAVDELEPETPKDTGPTSPLPDDEFWLEDGNLTLIASDVEFRVYKGPLIANSPVFRDMLSLPQPIPTQPDDRPDLRCTCGYAPALVHVSDSPEDLRHLLRALVPGKTPRYATIQTLFLTG